MAPRAPESNGSPPPLKRHAAALADITQRLELSLSAVREDPSASAERMEALAGEFERLRHFTRMLARVASPPARGGEEFDVGELFEERLAAMVLDSPKNVRFLPRGESGHVVRADRSVLTDAIGCVLSVARHCAAPDGVIKAPYDSPRPGVVTLGVEFPAGPLARSDPRELLRPGAPGAIADQAPDYGPADLATAAALLESQGGELRIRSSAGGRLLAELELPETSTV